MSPFLSTVLGVLFFALPTIATEEKSYCHDEVAARQWEELVENHPQDLELQRLHALRMGICIKIDMGSLSFEQGITIFEKEKHALLLKREEEERETQQEHMH